jgi:hypothetical protein
VESAIGQGSVFHFTAVFALAPATGYDALPTAVVLPGSSPYTPDTNSVGITTSASLRILLAEDNVVNQKLAVRIF